MYDNPFRFSSNFNLAHLSLHFMLRQSAVELVRCLWIDALGCMRSRHRWQMAGAMDKRKNYANSMVNNVSFPSRDDKMKTLQARIETWRKYYVVWIPVTLHTWFIFAQNGDVLNHAVMFWGVFFNIIRCKLLRLSIC